MNALPTLSAASGWPDAPGSTSATHPPPDATPHAHLDRRTATPPPRWRSEVLLAHGVDAEIEHAGQIYRLRKTALGKLILTK